MDETDWAASGLFSPSKARMVQAQARDWSFVDAWLANKYGSKRPPSFERNEETLQTLLTLATINEAADEQRGAVERVEKAALQSYSKQAAEPSGELYAAVVEHLGDAGRESLSALADAVVHLNAPTRDGAAGVASAIVALQAETFQLEQLAKRATEQRAALQRECARMTAILNDLRGEAFQPSIDITEQTAEWTKGSKQLRAKVGEYDERMSALRAASQVSPTIDEVLRLWEEVSQQRRRLSELGADMLAFHNLPTDQREARKTVEQAREELRRFTTRRDQLFENLVAKG